MRSIKLTPPDTVPLTVGRNCRTNYLQLALNPNKSHKLVTLCSRLVKRLQPDTVLTRGMSGALIGIPIAQKLKVHYAFVRRTEERSHGYSGIEGPYKLGRIVIIDDFVSSGGTLHAIDQAINNHNDETSSVVGLVLYNQDHESPSMSRIVSAIGHVPVGLVSLASSSAYFVSTTT